jgi:hypothetical protein
MVLVMRPPSGVDALLRKNRLQKKRATKATFDSLRLSSGTAEATLSDGLQDRD